MYTCMYNWDVSIYEYLIAWGVGTCKGLFGVVTLWRIKNISKAHSNWCKNQTFNTKVLKPGSDCMVKKTGLTGNRSLRQFFNFQKPFYTKKSNGLCEPSLNRLGLRTVSSFHGSSQSYFYLKNKNITDSQHQITIVEVSTITFCQTLN